MAILSVAITLAPEAPTLTVHTNNNKKNNYNNNNYNNNYNNNAKSYADRQTKFLWLAGPRNEVHWKILYPEF